MAQAAPWDSRSPGHTHRAACPGPPALLAELEGDMGVESALASWGTLSGALSSSRLMGFLAQAPLPMRNHIYPKPSRLSPWALPSLPPWSWLTELT